MKNFIRNWVLKRLRVNPAYEQVVTGGDRYSDGYRTQLPDEVLAVNADMGLRSYNVNPDVFTAVNIYCNAMSLIPIEIEARPKTRRVFKPVDEDESIVAKIIRNPNRKLTQHEFFWRFMAYRLLCGRAYAALEEADGEMYLFLLDPRYMKPVPSSNSAGVSGYVFDLPGADKPLFFESKYVLASEEFNPLDHWFGMSRIGSITNDINSRYNAIKNFSINESRGGAGLAVLSQDITAPQRLEEEQIKRLKREYDSRKVDSSRLMVLEQGQNFNLISKDSGTVSRDTILQINQHSVYNVFLLPYSFMSPSTNNEWDKATKFFYTFAILPELQNISQKFQQFFNTLLSQFGAEYRITFDTSEIDELKLYALNETKVDVAGLAAGFVTPDEIRKRRGETLYSQSDDEIVRDYGSMPRAVWDYKYGNKNSGTDLGTSPSLPLPGSLGGERDQSSTGEAQMIDTTGQKILRSLENDD